MDEESGASQYMTSGKYYKAKKSESGLFEDNSVRFCFTDDEGDQHYVSLIDAWEDHNDGILPSEICQVWDLPREEKEFILMVDPNFFTKEEKWQEW